MISPMNVWICMAALVAAIIVLRVLYAACHSPRLHHRGAHLIELGRERDEFWIPGDPRTADECEEADDL